MASNQWLQSVQERLRRYEAKLRRATLDDELARTRPSSDLNVAAANRFIANAIPDLTAEQKQALRDAAAAAEAEGGGGAPRESPEAAAAGG